MSKYIKLDDAIDSKCPCEDIWEGCINCPLQNSGIDPCKMGKWLNSLPTIEVSEDCVSKRYLMAEIDDLADEFSEVDENGLHSERWCGIMDSKWVIKNAPSVLPTTEQSSMVGEWIRDRYWSSGTGMGEEYGFFYKCSLCEYEVENGYTRCSFNYCPNCGAKMRLE